MGAKRIGETSYKQTAFGIIPRSKLIPLEIEGVKRAWDFILNARRRKKLPLTVAFIKKIHAVGFSWIFPDHGGAFRTIDVQVSGHTPPPPYRVHQYMEEYTRDLATRLQYLPPVSATSFLEALVELLAWVHHHFVWIHPFQDYNGRLARLLINVVLLNFNFPPVELKVETKLGRARYVKALNSADSGDYKLLEKIIYAALAEAGATLSAS